MSVDLETAASSDIQEYQNYREMSWSAVASCIFGLLSLATVATAEAMPWYLLVLVAGAGVSLGLGGLISIRKYDLGGRKAALAGICFATIGVTVGLGTKAYIYATEVPDGYERITYAQLQPTQPGQMMNPESEGLSGKRIFIKGYIYPGSQTTGITTLLLCRDKGDCCFGGKPKISDMIEVRLKNGLAIDFDTQLHGIAGVFRVEPGIATRGESTAQVIFHLDGESYH